MKRVTDLEDFALTQVWRPYQSKMGYEDRLERLPMSLDETARLLTTDDSGWASVVLDRICNIGFRFPPYIVHELVSVINAAQSSRRNALDKERGDG